MKTATSQFRIPSNLRRAIIDFLVFLLRPEDTSTAAMPFDRQHRDCRFDNRIGGAIKIFFWLVTTILFWICFADLAATISSAVGPTIEQPAGCQHPRCQPTQPDPPNRLRAH